MNIYEKAFRDSWFNKDLINNSDKVGCYFCQRIFDAKEIGQDDYVKGASNKDIAICPYCGCDSIIPDALGYPVTLEFLKEILLLDIPS